MDCFVASLLAMTDVELRRGQLLRREAPPDDRLRDLSAVAQRAKAEAIHSGHPKGGLLRRGACHRARIRATRWLLGNDGSRASIRMSNSGYTSAFSRREAPEVCVSLSLKRGSRECRMRAAPAVPCAKGRTKIAHEHTGQRRQSDIPCAMALRLITRSPRSIGLSCLRRLTETGTLARLGFRTSVET